MPPISPPLAQTKFNVNPAGVAGFFGGDEAISAMATVHFYEGRRWLGWYNSPGSGSMAKRFGTIANSWFWDTLFPGPNDTPSTSLGFDGKMGPQYVAALSGTTMSTGHFGHLIMERSKEVQARKIEGRVTAPLHVTYLAMKHNDYHSPVAVLPLSSALWSLIPIIVSVVACIMCALVYDWFSFSVISTGIITNGLASIAIGRGRLVIQSVRVPPDGVPPAHGTLMREDDVIVIKGGEQDVSAITRGRFVLGMNSYEDRLDPAPRHHDIGVCSLLLLLQLLVQLLLIPQGSFFGQLMFLVSLGVSWVYNFYLSSLDREKIQAALLLRALGNPEMVRFRVGTRTTWAVFVCLLLFHGVEHLAPEDPENRARHVELLHTYITNDTVIWRRWREKVVDQLLNIDETTDDTLPFLAENEDDQALSELDRRLLRVLLSDAGAAIRGYLQFRDTLPTDSSQQLKE